MITLLSDFHPSRLSKDEPETISQAGLNRMADWAERIIYGIIINRDLSEKEKNNLCEYTVGVIRTISTEKVSYAQVCKFISAEGSEVIGEEMSAWEIWQERLPVITDLYFQTVMVTAKTALLER